MGKDKKVLQPEVSTGKWKQEAPAKPGRYLFYGFPHILSRRPALLLCTVEAVGSGPLLIKSEENLISATALEDVKRSGRGWAFAKIDIDGLPDVSENL